MESYFYQLPAGADPNDPRVQKMIFDQFNQYQHRGHRMPPQELLNNEHYINQMKAQTALMVADLRQRDSELFRNALAEIRAAMNTYKISDGDKGSTERPPIDSSFDDVNMGKLQEAYLNITMRYVKFIDEICEHDFQFTPPGSIADKPKASNAKKKTEKGSVQPQGDKT